MRHVHERYLRDAYKAYQESLNWCKKCDPPSAPIKKIWEDAIESLVDYVNYIAIPAGFSTAVKCDKGDVFSWKSEGGVLEGDSYDSGRRSWYYKLAKNEKEKWEDSPVEAVIACVKELEKKVDADPAAPKLIFSVRFPKFECVGDDHDWYYIGTGRHGSDKGVDTYNCRLCKAHKDVG